MSYTAPNFVNGTAPAVSAANLNALAQAVQAAAVTADIGTAGTATDNALRNSYATKVTISVKDYGAKGDGTTDDSAAFAAAASAAKAALRTVPYGLQANQSGSIVITVPPGDYLITNPGAFLGDEAMTTNGVGLSWLGAGMTITNIIFKPTTAGALITNDYWLTLKFADLGFLADTADCTLMQSYTTHAAQRNQFVSCGFSGWKYGVDLQGNNNNSEFRFEYCHISGQQANGAFLYIGATNTSDQFLNYWFNDCTYWSTSAPFIDAAMGGHFHIRNLDVSDWGAALAAAGKLFYLRGTTHALGVCNLEASLRVEAKSTFAGLLYSEWPQGNVSMAVDWSSQAAAYTYGNDVISISYVNVPGPNYNFHDSQLAGGVRVKFGSNEYAYAHHITFTDCAWLQKNSPSDVVTYDTSGAGGNVAPIPPVEFVRCSGPAQNVYATTGNGATTWDATIGYRGQPMQPAKQRSLALRGGAGLPSGASDVLRFTLPVGALITGFEAISPAGAVTEADGGTWTLATTEVTPATVVAVTVTGAMSAGFDVSASPSVPFECSTQAKATLTITPTNVAQWNTAGLLLVKGYW